MQLLISVSAIGGGVGLIFTNGLGMPISYLEDSFFSSFFIPGLILTVVVGGLHLLAAYLHFRKNTYAIEVSAIAAFGLLIWIFTEVNVIPEHNILQMLYFMLAIIEIILTFLASAFTHHDAFVRTLISGRRTRL